MSATTATACSTTGISPSCSIASSANTTDARPRGPNHPTNKTVAAVQPRSEQGQGDRNHADHGQTQYGVREQREVEVVHGDRHQRGSEEEPDGECQDLTEKLR